jgi:hypothetical protein
MNQEQKHPKVKAKKKGNGFSGSSFEPQVQAPDLDELLAKADTVLQQEQEQKQESDSYTGLGRCGC